MDQQVQLLLDQIYHQEPNIRSLAEKQLNTIFNDLDSIKQAFLLLHTEPSDAYKLKLVIYVKNWIRNHYKFSPRYVQVEIQMSMLKYYQIYDAQIRAHTHEIMASLVQIDFPNSPMLDYFLELQTYKVVELEILNEVFDKIQQYRKQLHPIYRNLFQKLVNYIQKTYPYVNLCIQPLKLLYRIIKSHLYIENLLDFILQQLSGIECWQHYREVLLLYLKCLSKHLITQQTYFTVQQFQQTYQVISIFISGQPVYNYNCNLANYQSLEQFVADQNKNIKIEQIYYKIHSKVISIIGILIRAEASMISACQSLMIVDYILLQIRMDHNQFYELLITEDDIQVSSGSYNVQIRRNAQDLLDSMLDYMSETLIAQHIQKLLQVFDNSTPTLNFNEMINKEALLFLVSVIYKHVKQEFELDTYYEHQFANELLFDSMLYTHIKLQICNIIKQDSKKQWYSEAMPIRIVELLLSLLQKQQHPLLVISMLQTITMLVGSAQQTNQVQVYLQSVMPNIKQYWSICKKPEHISEILELYIMLGTLQLEEQFTIKSIMELWQSSQSDTHLYKSTVKIVLYAIYRITEVWSIVQYQPYQFGIINILTYCVNKNIHLESTLKLMIKLLSKYASQEEYQISFNSYIDQFEQIQIGFINQVQQDSEHIHTILQAYSFIVLLDLQDHLQVTQLCSQLFHIIQYKLDVFQIFALSLFSHQESSYQSVKQLMLLLLKEQIYDQGITYSHICCWLGILTQFDYDVKQLILDVQEQSPFKDFLPILLFKAFEVYKYQRDYQTNYFIYFILGLLNRENIIFDMAYMNINCDQNNFQDTLITYVKELQKQYDPTKSIIEVLKNQHIYKQHCNMCVNDTIMLKYQCPDLPLSSNGEQLLNIFNKMELN